MKKISNSFYFFLNIFQEMFMNLFSDSKAVQSGEIVVSGKDCLKLDLFKMPKHLDVHFKDECHVTPCNPAHIDHLNYFLNKNGNKIKLNINWEVSGIRTLSWTIKF